MGKNRTKFHSNWLTEEQIRGGVGSFFSEKDIDDGICGCLAKTDLWNKSYEDLIPLDFAIKEVKNETFVEL